MKLMSKDVTYPALNKRAFCILSGTWIDLLSSQLPGIALSAIFTPVSAKIGGYALVFGNLAGLVGLVIMAHRGFSPSKWVFGYQIVDKDNAEPVGFLRYFGRSIVATLSSFIYIFLAMLPALLAKTFATVTSASTYREARHAGHHFQDAQDEHAGNAMAAGAAGAATTGLIAMIHKYGLLHDKIFKTCAIDMPRKAMWAQLFVPRAPVVDFSDEEVHSEDAQKVA